MALDANLLFFAYWNSHKIKFHEVLTQTEFGYV